VKRPLPALRPIFAMTSSPPLAPLANDTVVISRRPRVSRATTDVQAAGQEIRDGSGSPVSSASTATAVSHP
jgi:hypothetical protein